jgi:hypothetical protein
VATGRQPRLAYRPAQGPLPGAWPADPGGSTDCLYRWRLDESVPVLSVPSICRFFRFVRESST